MGTILKLFKHLSIDDVQKDFNKAYPFLNIEFYNKSMLPARQRINKGTSLKMAGLREEGVLKASPWMTVKDLERIFREKFGPVVQVTRKSGRVWLETNMTDSWTLEAQNERGSELAEPLKRTGTDNLPDVY